MTVRLCDISATLDLLVGKLSNYSNLTKNNLITPNTVMLCKMCIILQQEDIEQKDIHQFAPSNLIK